MKPFNKTRRSILIAIIGIAMYMYWVDKIDHMGFLEFIPIFLLSIVSISIYIWTIVNDRRAYLKSKSLTEFLPTAIGAVCIIAMCLTTLFFNWQDNVKSFLFCEASDNDLTYISIDFKENGRYIIHERFFDENNYRGKYTFKDSIIYIEHSEMNNIIHSERLLVRPEIYIRDLDSLSKDTLYYTKIYQIDKNGKVIQNALSFNKKEKI